MDIPLSNRQISEFLNNDVTIIIYRNLKNYKNINQLFSKSNNVVLLYETSPNVGHWITIINHDDHVEFFDSYGFKPDLEKKMINTKYLQNSGQINNYVIKLLQDTHKKVIYNEKPLQQRKDNISTCGRHCITRIILKNIPLVKYQKMLLKYGISFSDIFVTYFTTI
jgi:hypothetical protein